MTVDERIKDISKRCGMSEDIVRRVLSAEQRSIIESLKRGERSTLIGRCVIKPEIRNRITADGLRKTIKLKAQVADAINNELECIEEFTVDTVEDDDRELKGIRVMQLSSLI